jgi:hypothetical protein
VGQSAFLKSAPFRWDWEALTWIRAHGRRFYNFDGLEAFKAKFQPRAWEPIFAISREPRFSPHTLYAIAAAFSDGSPMWAVARGLVKALRQEFCWLIGGRSSGSSSRKATL